METITLNNIEYRQSSLAPRVYVAKDGTYILPTAKHGKMDVRYPTKTYNKKKYPLAAIVCTTVDDPSTPRGYKIYVANMGRLVLDAWKDQRDPNLQVDHIDRNPFNNNVDNLRLVTPKENMANRSNREFNPTWLHNENNYTKIRNSWNKRKEARKQLDDKINATINQSMSLSHRFFNLYGYRPKENMNQYSMEFQYNQQHGHMHIEEDIYLKNNPNEEV